MKTTHSYLINGTRVNGAYHKALFKFFKFYDDIYKFKKTLNSTDVNNYILYLLLYKLFKESLVQLEKLTVIYC